MVLSITKSTPRSIGCTIKGIAASPTIVGTEFRTIFKGDMSVTFLVHLTTCWIVKPGINTEAKVCHISVSAAAFEHSDCLDEVGK